MSAHKQAQPGDPVPKFQAIPWLHEPYLSHLKVFQEACYVARDAGETFDPRARMKHELFQVLEGVRVRHLLVGSVRGAEEEQSEELRQDFIPWELPEEAPCKCGLIYVQPFVYSSRQTRVVIASRMPQKGCAKLSACWNALMYTQQTR